MFELLRRADVWGVGSVASAAGEVANCGRTSTSRGQLKMDESKVNVSKMAGPCPHLRHRFPMDL